jgi:hypothetical protein
MHLELWIDESLKCPPRVRKKPDLAQLAEQAAAEGAAVLGIAPNPFPLPRPSHDHPGMSTAVNGQRA